MPHGRHRRGLRLPERLRRPAGLFDPQPARDWCHCPTATANATPPSRCCTFKATVRSRSLLEGPFPPEKIYDQGLQAQGYRHGGYEGLPRFEKCAFEAAYPFGKVSLHDDDGAAGGDGHRLESVYPARRHRIPASRARFWNTALRIHRASGRFEFSYHLSHLARRDGLERHAQCELLEDQGRVLLQHGGRPRGSLRQGRLAASSAARRRSRRCGFAAAGSTPFPLCGAKSRRGTFTRQQRATATRSSTGATAARFCCQATLAPGESITYPHRHRLAFSQLLSNS